VRAMVAQNLHPHFTAQAKERQGTRTDLNIVEKVPQRIDASKRAMIAAENHPQPTKSRDQAGKAAGVNGRYVDMAGQVAKALLPMLMTCWP